MESLRGAMPLSAIPPRSFAYQSIVLLVQGDDSDIVTALNMVSCLVELHYLYAETNVIHHENLFVSHANLAQQ